MKGEVFRVFLIISLIISMVAVAGVGATPGPVISVDPKKVEDKWPGETFTVDITVADIASYKSLYGWDFGISFNDPITDTWAGDGETKSFVTTEKPVLYESEEVYVNRTFMPRVPEETDTWTGDGKQTTFYTTRKQIRTNSEEVYVDETLMARVHDYKIDYDTGNITFYFGEEIPTAPGVGAEIKATYDYTYYTIGYPTGTITFTTAPGLGAEIEAIYLFKPPILQVVSVMEGPFLKTAGNTSWGMVPPEIDNYRGKIIVTDGLWTFPPEGATGSGVLCNITFQVKAEGKTTLHFYKIQLWTHDGTRLVPIEYVAEDGLFTNVHDIAVTSVTALPTSVNLSDPVFINVTVANEGDFPETFDVTTYWEIGPLSELIDTEEDVSLEPRTSTTLTFKWDTTDGGNYTIFAEASKVPGENKTDNNIKCFDGVVKVKGPVATFTASSVTPLLDEEVTFNASASYDPDGGNIISYEWYFDDGTPVVTETSPITNHTYREPGEYHVVLKVTDDEGEKGISQPQLITVMGYPVAFFTCSPEPRLKNWPVTFDASLSDPKGGTIDSYAWDFGEGTTKIYVKDVNLTDTTTHTYTDAGTYPVTLTVTDSEDLTDSFTRNVTVLIKHDVAVVSLSCDSEVHSGQWVTIEIDVRNEGSETETFNITVYLDDTPIETREVPDLAPLETRPLKLYSILDTTSLSAGEYTISAIASTVQGENDTANNKANVTMRVNVADVAITSITASPTTVLAGDLLNITVVVKNEGTDDIGSPGITVKIYLTNTIHSNMLIENFAIPGIAKGAEKTVSRNCSVTEDQLERHIYPGTYTLSAEVLPIALESDLADNTYTYGNVTVGASLISISANPEIITVGSTTTINGSITPVRSDVNVTIQYRLSGDETWNTLETVTTDENSTYSYDWTPETAETYQVKASWLGDNDTLPSESEILVITVNPAPPNVFLYVVAAVAVIVMAATAIYLLRVRKSKPT